MIDPDLIEMAHHLNEQEERHQLTNTLTNWVGFIANTVVWLATVFVVVAALFHAAGVL